MIPQPDGPVPDSHAAEMQTTRRWLLLAAGVIIAAGAFAGLLVVARTPPFDRLVTDPAFFRRALVVHVNLALICWFMAFIAALLSLLPGRPNRVTRAAPLVSAAGVALLGIASASHAEPVLSNYVPMIDHPLFTLGHGVFGLGVLLSLADGRLLHEGTSWYGLRPEAIPGLRATALALLLATLTFMGSAARAPVGVDTTTYWELLNWGGGHVLQLASEAAMVALWLHGLGSALDRPVLSRPASTAAFALLLMPWMAAPLLPLVYGTQDVTYHSGFTTLMRWGIFPVVLFVLGASLRALLQARREGRLNTGALLDVRVTGFLASGALTTLGFVLGAFIRGSNTVVPAHYHAAIGAVTAAFMATSWSMFAAVGWPLPARRARLAALQAPLFGVGQLIFAVGFALAGAHGMARKTYGAEQIHRSLAETVGLGVMGIGGLLAMTGGLLFLWLAASAMWSVRDAAARDAAARATPSLPSSVS